MDKIYFTINGEHYSLSGSEVSPHTSLSDYIRDYLRLRGTKVMCQEGGCGACVVSVSRTHPSSKEKQIFAVNSCLVHILSCHQWDITTVEGVGNRKDGYHGIQSRLAAFNGTQCGYCTPGWVMNMYSLYESSHKRLTSRQIEDSFAGNMCRCTGYRPILDALKSFATDASPDLTSRIPDVEDLHKTQCGGCTRRCRQCSGSVSEDWCVIENKKHTLLDIEMQKSRWYKAFTVADVFKILAKEGSISYTLVAGNTGQVTKSKETRIQVDISSIESLKETMVDVNLVLGAGLSLSELMQQLDAYSKRDDFKYLRTFYQHCALVANLPVRNVGTIGGNLAIKNQYHSFPSDIFLLLATVQATVTIVNSALEKKEVGMQDFVNEDLRDKLIVDVKLPPLSQYCLVRTYKEMGRAQNSYAIVNAGFLFKLDSANKVVTSNIVFGNISPSFIRATETENVLKVRFRNSPDQELFKEETLQKALRQLSLELVPDDSPPIPSPLCRKTLALGLFYKAMLSLCPTVAPRYRSGGSLIERGVSHGTQTFDTDKSLWPLNQPIPKLEALTQCSGEAKYACDGDSSPREVHVAFVLSTACVADIDKIDPSEALKIPGVIAFFSAKDIPGKNTFTPLDVPWQESEEEFLAGTKTSYYGQPLGVIAAVTHKLALTAAGLVKVQYKNLQQPVLTIRDALKAKDKDRRVRAEPPILPTDKGTDTKHVIKGSFTAPSQYHYTMETQSCRVETTDTGLLVTSSTQWMDLVNVAVAQALAIPSHKVLVSVPRVGGAYGGKASRSALAACACALVALRLDRPATLVMSLPQNMAAIGKRQECLFDYEIGVNDDGLIQYVDLSYYSDCGHSFNDSAAAEISTTLTNLYQSARWSVAGHSVRTDKPSHTWCRAPSTTEATAILEHIMERIAHVTNKDPIDIRILHLSPEHSAIKEIITTFKTDSKYVERKAEITKFNSENAWKKRGLKLSIMSYPISFSVTFPITISVYHSDGSISISHGGIEMGQGINTKVAQVCAYKLKVPLDKIVVLGSDSFVSPNAMASNGSITSESVCRACLRACDELLGRVGRAGEWGERVKAAYEKGINLQVSHLPLRTDPLNGYSVYGACAAEVELDVLTASHCVTRVDLLENTGVSLSPDVDVGQIEGAFVMGLGMWTTEQLIYDQSTGRLLTDDTFTYRPPGAKDIPVDFRVSFIRNPASDAPVLRSKATGEPAMVLAVAVTHALHDAVLAAREEFAYQDTEWVNVDTPYSTENILKAIAAKMESFKFT